MTRARWLLVPCLASLSMACTRAEGEGEVSSQKLYIQECWNRTFQLGPTFFGANPYQNTLSIRIQRGDNLEEVSDGLIVLVDDVAKIRKAPGMPQEVGMPVGVTPPGVPVKYNANPPGVHLSLYLHDTCHEQNGTVYSVGGQITFHSLFDGDINESNADDRYTDAEFKGVTFGDPRQLGPDGNIDPAKTSQVDGWFKFYFQRGQPAQPFQ